MPRSNTFTVRLSTVYSAVSICFALVATSLLFSSSAFAEDHGEMDSLLNALSHRCSTHGAPSLASLEKIAGSEDALIEFLLEYRTKEQPPFVGIRAQKLLLSYADRSDVAEALASDIDSAEYLGLARVIGANIDAVNDESARRLLASRIIARGKRDSSFTPYAKSLIGSNNAEVSSLARQAFE